MDAASSRGTRARGEQEGGDEHEHEYEYEHEYDDLGPDHFDRLDKTEAAARLVRHLKQLGYEVEIKHAA